MCKIQMQKYLFSALILLLLSGCAKNIDNELTKQQAIEVAIKIVSMSEPEIGGSQVEPFNIIAEKMTLEEYVKRFNENSQNAFSEAFPDTQVWLVSMDGVWLGPEVPDVPQQPYRHLSIVINAKTGLEIFRNVQ